MSGSEPNWITDTKALRALAHPVRWQLLQLFEVEDAMTATRGSEITGESVASCSYHLNTLARYGFIEPAGTSGGREKPWRMVSHDHSWRAGGEGLDDEGAVAAVALSDVAVDEITAHLKSWFRWRSREEPRWVDAAGFSENVLYLTSDELGELTEELRAVTRRHLEHAKGRPRPEGSRAVRVVTSTSMRRPPESEEQAP